MTSLQTPAPFNGSDAVEYLVAPFWSDISTQSAGSVSYEIHTNETSSLLLHRVSKYIRHQEMNQFGGTWMLAAEWDSVPSPGNVFSIQWLIRPVGRAEGGGGGGGGRFN